jgi:glycyl-tRNA synthetase beta chain
MAERDLLLEIGTEEIPARFLSWILEELLRIAEAELKAAHLFVGGMESFATPRRIALFFRKVPERQQDIVQELRGPAWNQAFDANGNPTNAARGFARSKNIAVEDLIQKNVGGIDYAFAVTRTEGDLSKNVFLEVLPRIVKRIVFPKNMYWDDPAFRFARPVRWLLCLWGSEVLPFTVGKHRAGRTTRGHRFMGQKTLEISDVKEYMDLLYDNYVIVDQRKRKEKMLSGIAALEKEIGGKADLSQELIEENLFLVEYPVPFYGTFDQSYLELPAEVLITTMGHHQRYFPVRDAEGKLKPFFIGVSNNRASNMNVVREGNERVLRARLSDAAFFWKEDLKRPLATRVEELRTILYQEHLGSVYDKVQRARVLALAIGRRLGLSEEDLLLLDRAAVISKADTVTHMVYEFPELRGIMGREYACRNGEPERVAKALQEQYLPAFAGDRLPTDVLGALLGIGDRLDTIVACHKVGLEPTGSQDPYGLRRAARCINELLWGMGLDVDIKEMVLEAASCLELAPETIARVYEFLRQRAVVQLREKGFSHATVTIAMEVAWQRPLQALRLAESFAAVEQEAWFDGLVTAAVRVRNILSKTDAMPPEWDETLLHEPAERALAKAVVEIVPEVERMLAGCAWNELTHVLSRLEPAITTFFEKTLVMAEDEKLRRNRLCLLSRCHELFMNLGDLGRLKK